MKPERDVRIAEDEAALARCGAELFAEIARGAVERAGAGRVALSGGRTPRALYERLAGDDRERVPWERLELYMGDERYVPPDHPESNARMVRASLLDPLGFPAERFVRFETEAGPPDAVAARFEAEVRRRFVLGEGAWPRFDLMLLGVGPDGHTASIFPRSAALRVRDRIAVAEWVERLGQHRLTLTLPVLNAAAHVVFLASGPAKAPVVRAILEDRPEASGLPAAQVQPPRGRVTWLLDRAAAAELRL